CLREDVAILFSKYHSAKFILAGRTLRLSKEKGWLIPPPLHLIGTDVPAPNK
ncbi:MAG: DUF3231 family protein, partial [Gorillibacterium sp.]|nr:DUF3231 family protein [Gorillibacterium sp.]